MPNQCCLCKRNMQHVFGLPKDPAVRGTWIKFLTDNKFIHKKRRTYFLCYKHFTKADFQNYAQWRFEHERGQPFKLLLKKDACPSIGTEYHGAEDRCHTEASSEIPSVVMMMRATGEVEGFDASDLSPATTAQELFDGNVDAVSRCETAEGSTFSYAEGGLVVTDSVLTVAQPSNHQRPYVPVLCAPRVGNTCPSADHSLPCNLRGDPGMSKPPISTDEIELLPITQSAYNRSLAFNEIPESRPAIYADSPKLAVPPQRDDLPLKDLCSSDARKKRPELVGLVPTVSHAVLEIPHQILSSRTGMKQKCDSYRPDEADTEIPKKQLKMDYLRVPQMPIVHSDSATEEDRGYALRKLLPAITVQDAVSRCETIGESKLSSGEGSLVATDSRLVVQLNKHQRPSVSLLCESSLTDSFDGGIWNSLTDTNALCGQSNQELPEVSVQEDYSSGVQLGLNPTSLEYSSWLSPNRENRQDGIDWGLPKESSTVPLFSC